MISTRALTALFIIASVSSLGCTRSDGDGDGDDAQDDRSSPPPAATTPPAAPGTTPSAERTGPGADATDRRSPELGGDPTIVLKSKIALSAALAQADKPCVEAKFELADDGKSLSLSLYPLGKGVAMDAERNEFHELSGDPTASPWRPSDDVFKAGDFEHLVRSSRDLTLVQLSKTSLAEVVASQSKDGVVYWAIPTIEKRRAGYGVYLLKNGKDSVYRFVDGGGSRASTIAQLVDLGGGPGASATDARAPEIDDLSVLATSKVKMADALTQMELQHGPMIEAKFEPNDAGKLSLSLYPVGKGIATDPENNEFHELSGEVSGAYAPDDTIFKADDFEHLTRSARDLTLVQTASVTLAQAVSAAQAAMPGGFVYWAVPTIRDARAGFGVYVYGTDKKAHYFFVS